MEASEKQSLFVGWKTYTTVLEKAIESALKIPIPIRHLCVCILSQPKMLIALRSEVNVEVIKPIALDLVRMLMTFSVVSSQPKHLRRRFDGVGKYRREVKDIEKALPEDQSEFRPVFAFNIQLALFMTLLRLELKPARVSRLERLGFIYESRDFGVGEECAQRSIPRMNRPVPLLQRDEVQRKDKPLGWEGDD
jgi:hypothetical protein